MLTFDPAKWGDTELERWNGVVRETFFPEEVLT